MIEILFEEVYGTAAPSGSTQLKEFTQNLVALPQNIYYAIYHYYVLGETKTAIASSSAAPLHLVERRIKNGISLLKAACVCEK